MPLEEEVPLEEVEEIKPEEEPENKVIRKKKQLVKKAKTSK